MSSYISSSLVSTTFKVTLHYAWSWLSLTQTEEVNAFAASQKVNVSDGAAWQVEISAPFRPRASIANTNITDARGRRGNISGPEGMLASSLGMPHVGIRLIAVPNDAENVVSGSWTRDVDINLEAVLVDHRHHTHEPISTSLLAWHLFTPSSLAKSLKVPLPDIFHPERTIGQEFDISFVFTIKSVHSDATAGSDAMQVPRHKMEMSSSKATSVSLATLRPARAPTPRPDPGSALPSVRDAAPAAVSPPVQRSGPLGSTSASQRAGLSKAALNAIASTLTDGVWGDVCFVLKDPNVGASYRYVYGNSKLIGERSLFLSRMIEEAGRHSVQAAIDTLEQRENECRDTVGARFPHEVADSDFCAYIAPGEGTGEGRKDTSESRVSRFLECTDTSDMGSAAKEGTRLRSNSVEPPEQAKRQGTPPASSNGSASNSSPNASRHLTLGRFRGRKSKSKPTLDEAIDLFGIRLDDVGAPSESGNSTGPVRDGVRGNGELGASSGTSIKYVAIRDAAATTFQRLVFWLETDEIVFAPLLSAGLASQPGSGLGSRAAFTASYLAANPHHPVPASAKSIYRLADAYRIPELQDLALSFIRSQLRPANILRELFSPFTLQHPKVREMQLDYALRHWDKIKHGLGQGQGSPSNLDKVLAQSHFTPEAAKLLGRILSMATMDVQRGIDTDAADEEE